MTSVLRLRTLVLAAVLVPVWTAPATSQLRPVRQPYCQPSDSRIPILVIGSYHMANPGLDRFNLDADDVLTPRRQEEIESLVASLAAFEPTKVAIEAPWGSTSQQRAYGAYRAGEAELNRNERQQLGFRLAGRMDHDSVHPVDVKVSLPGDRLEAVVEKNPAHGRRMEALERYGNRALEIMARWLEEGSIGEMLYRMNTPAALAWAHRPYADMLLHLVEDEEYGGPEYVAEWYRRNLMIFGNLRRLATGPDDRITVIYGQGHAKLLRDFVRDASDLCVEDPLPYLEPGS